MLQFDASLLVRANTLLIRHIFEMKRLPDEKADIPKVLGTLKLLEERCSPLGLTVSCNMIKETAGAIERVENATQRLVIAELETISNTIANELKSFIFLRVNPEVAKYYSDIQPFGSDASDKFTSAVVDMESAGKAVSCGLGTAAVFHLMRVMEVTLKDLAKQLKIPYAPSWESYLNQIEKKITAKHKTKNIRWKRDEPYFREILGDLQAIKIAWRNPTMHIVRHYSQDEADDVYRAVRRFTKRLAEKLLNKR